MVDPQFEYVDEPKAKKRRRKRIIALNAVIDAAVIISLIYIGLVYGPFLFQEARYYVRRGFGKNYIIAEDASLSGPLPANTVAGSVLQGVPSIAIEPKDRNFGIIIEKIGVNERVVANVDPTDMDEYRASLKEGVAHADGTVFPGEVGNVYLFSHSTANVWDIIRYKSYFTLLRKLEVGDRVIMFYGGNRYDYIVYERRIIKPEETGDLSGYATEPILTLQTCEPPGSDARRLIVKARLSGYELTED